MELLTVATVSWGTVFRVRGGPARRLSRMAGVLTLLASMSVRAHAALTLVEGGEPRTTIVLPGETEWVRYINASPEEIAAFARKRFPNATAERLAEAIEKLPAERRKKANRVGDDEVLAVEELVAFVQKMSEAELPVTRPAAGEARPEGALILLGTELARAEGLAKEIEA